MAPTCLTTQFTHPPNVYKEVVAMVMTPVKTKVYSTAHLICLVGEVRIKKVVEQAQE